MTSQLANTILNLTIGSCSCGTKTPEVQFHQNTCAYKMANAALKAIEILEEITAFGKRNSGYGYSCHKKAEEALKELNEMFLKVKV